MDGGNVVAGSVLNYSSLALAATSVIDVDGDKVAALLSRLDAGLLTLTEQGIHLAGSAQHLLYSECLLRSVDSPNGPSLFPSIVAAEARNRIRPIDHFVALEVLRRLEQRPKDRLGFNISAKSAALDAGWIEFFSRLDARADLAQRLVIEITETATLPYDCPAFFEALRVRGVKIALDDFGSGHNTAERIRIVRPDIIKIDSQFTHRARDCAAQKTSLRRLVTELRRYGAVVVLEGVEKEVDRSTAFFAGIAWLQGFGVR